MRIVLLGAPGAGKGTQAKKLAERFGLLHISTGDILRHECKNCSDLGLQAESYMKSGKLVPDELIIEIIKNEISKGDSKDKFLMDGFPRTLNQAEMFGGMLESMAIKLDKVINIDVADEVLIKRLTDRRMCHSCSNICRIRSNTGEGTGEDRCPVCGGELYKRKDDEVSVIKERLKVYKNQTLPLIDYYRKKGLLVDIDGHGDEDAITERVLAVL